MEHLEESKRDKTEGSDYIMHISKKTLYIIVIIILMFILLASCGNFLERENYYENYVPIGYKENKVFEFVNGDINLHFIWSNENTTKGPYRLLIITEALNENIDNIYIENMKINSITNKNYEFTSISDWPFLIYNVDKKDAHLEYDQENEFRRIYKFSDIFDFDFENGETFKLQIKIRYEGEGINKEEIIEIEYEPYIEEYHVFII